MSVGVTDDNEGDNEHGDRRGWGALGYDGLGRPMITVHASLLSRCQQRGPCQGGSMEVIKREKGEMVGVTD